MTGTDNNHVHGLTEPMDALLRQQDRRAAGLELRRSSLYWYGCVANTLSWLIVEIMAEGLLLMAGTNGALAAYSAMGLYYDGKRRPGLPKLVR